MENWQEFEKKIIVTGGAGFIGSNLLEYLTAKYPHYLLVNLDCLTYAANQKSLTAATSRPNYRFEKIDIRNAAAIRQCFEKYSPDGIIHLAAETHVDRSIADPSEFIKTNIEGTFNLLEATRSIARNGLRPRFHHISTDEVFGAEETGEAFTEESKYYPNSPYAATKAAADHLVRAWGSTYNMNVVTTNCGNNFGPHQYPEKLIPLAIINALDNRPIPLYGDGSQVRDWIYVRDHCRGIDLVFHEGTAGETYNIGARNELANAAIVTKVCNLMDKILGGGPRRELIQKTADRPGHDRRYAIDPSKIESELRWQPEHSFETALEKTVAGYLENRDWLRSCLNDNYHEYYKRQYAGR